MTELGPSHTLVFLGTGGGEGVPSYYCGCRACQEALTQPEYRRTRCGLAVIGEQTTLIDAPPDLRSQLVREGLNRVDNLVFTHWHYDHCGGTGDVEFYVRLHRDEALPVYGSDRTLDVVSRTFWYMDDCLDQRPVGAGDTVTIDGVDFQPLEVTHAEGTVGWLLTGPGGGTCAYLPDTGPLPDATARRIDGVGTLIIGAPFWGRNWMPEDHLSMDESVDIAQRAQAGRSYFTHMSMHHDTPVTNHELESYLQDRGRGLHLAYDGTRIEL